MKKGVRYKFKHFLPGPLAVAPRKDSVDLEIIVKKSEAAILERYLLIVDPVETDWLTHKDEFSELMAGSTFEWYQTFVSNWRSQGYFLNPSVNCLEWLKRHEVTTTSVRFINATVTNIIKEFGMVIAAADSILLAEHQDIYTQLGQKFSGEYSGISIRYVAGTNVPSNHATGAAIDFRVPQNPMIRSANQRHALFIQRLSGLNVLNAKSAQQVTDAHAVLMKKYHGDNYESTNGTYDAIRRKYILTGNYLANGSIPFVELKKLNIQELVVKDFGNKKSDLITFLTAQKNVTVFTDASLAGVDALVEYVRGIESDTIPKNTDSNIQLFFSELDEFTTAISSMGFTDFVDLANYFNGNKLYGNLLYEHGFCDNNIEIYHAFNKAHKLVSKKITGSEIPVEWGGIYSGHIDGMHFSLNEYFLEIITNRE